MAAMDDTFLDHIPYPDENMTRMQVLLEASSRRRIARELGDEFRRRVMVGNETFPPGFVFCISPLCHSCPPLLTRAVSSCSSHHSLSLLSSSFIYSPHIHEPLPQSFPLDATLSSASSSFSAAPTTPSSLSLSSAVSSASSSAPSRSSSAAASPSARGTAARRHVCSTCGVAYTKKAHLVEHVLKHQGIKPHACAWAGCTRRFVRRDELVRHTRVHTGERNHPCPHCGFRFRRSDHLRKHMRAKHPSAAPPQRS